MAQWPNGMGCQDWAWMTQLYLRGESQLRGVQRLRPRLEAPFSERFLGRNRGDFIGLNGDLMILMLIAL